MRERERKSRKGEAAGAGIVQRTHWVCRAGARGATARGGVCAPGPRVRARPRYHATPTPVDQTRVAGVRGQRVHVSRVGKCV